MSDTRLDFGTLPKEERTSSRPRHLLALTGGGFRGIFSAQVLSRLETTAQRSLSTCFDLIGGTSIGGIIAIGIACGIPAETIMEMMRDHGPGIFKAKHTAFGSLATSSYDPDPLRKAIVSILGKPNADRPFSDIPAKLAVVAVDERASEPRIFKTEALAGRFADRISTVDVALATSAAPTYFPPHRIGDDVFVDGGLIANAPDVILIGEAMRSFGSKLDDLHLFSVGTASNARVGRAGGAPGKLQWMTQHGLIDLIMDSQVALAIQQIRRLNPATVLRVDRRPSRNIDLADVEPETRDELLSLANQECNSLEQTANWLRFAAHRAI